VANYHNLKNAAILTPATNTDLGSDANRYANVFMSGNIVMSNGVIVTSTNAVAPRIVSLTLPGTETAISTAGGETVTITGSGFSNTNGSPSVLIGSTAASSMTYNSSVSISFVAPMLSAGTYVIYVINADGGTATYIPGLSYSGTPTWSTSAGSLGNVGSASAASFTVTATGDAPITYAVKAGSSLPAGLSLNSSTGAITGTAPTVGSTTVYNFTLTASDLQNQTTDRAFSISVIGLLSSIEYLIVAGGGGGGAHYNAGGGGAGGLLTQSSVAISVGTTYTITVGAGGAAVSINDTQGGNGTVSLMSGSGFSTVTATGGGGGGSFSSGYRGRNGGSGGGTSGYATNTAYRGLGTAGQGSDGGKGGSYGAGGGGGKGGVGANGTASNGGAGGTGYEWPTSSATYYAGGGGGAAYGNSSGDGSVRGAGGSSVGGTGANYDFNATAGATNTGGGGGGAGGYNTALTNYTTSGAGGSGVVILRYSDAFAAAATTTGSPTITTAGGYRTYKFTASGTITF